MGISAVIGGLIEGIGDIGGAALGGLGALGGDALGAIGGIGSGIEGAVGGIGSAIESGVGAVGSGLGELGTGVESALGIGGDAAAGAAGAGASGLGSAGSATSGLLGSLGAAPAGASDALALAPSAGAAGAGGAGASVLGGAAPASLGAGAATAGDVTSTLADSGLLGGALNGGGAAGAGALGSAGAAGASAAAGAGAPSALGGLSLGSIGSTLTSPSVLLGGAGLGYNLLKGSGSGETQMAQNALEVEAMGLNKQGKQNASYLQNGTLPPGMQAQLDQAHQSAEATIRSQYAQRGQTGSSAEAQDLANLSRTVVSQGASIATQLSQQGISEEEYASGLYGQLLNASLAQDKETSQAISSFSGALAGSGLRGLGTTPTTTTYT